MTKSLRRPASDAVDRLLNPKSIAVVGSLREARFGGYVTTSNLLRFGYKGKIFPVNPQYERVLDLKVYPSVKDIPEPVDLVVTMAGAPAVPKIIADSVQNRAKAAIIISDGFGERNEDGKRLQQEVNRIAEAGGLRLLGPNTIGVANPAIGLITTPYRVTYDKMITGGDCALRSDRADRPAEHAAGGNPLRPEQDVRFRQQVRYRRDRPPGLPG